MDTLISNVTAVTMNPRMEVIFGAYIDIEDGKIVSIERKPPAEAPKAIVDGTGMALSTATPIWRPPVCGASPMIWATPKPFRRCCKRKRKWTPAAPKRRHLLPSPSACASASPRFPTCITTPTPPPRPWRSPASRPIWRCPATASSTKTRTLTSRPTSSAGSW